MRLRRMVLAWALVAGVAAWAQVDGAPRIDVPAGDAARALRIFARQAGVQLVYPADEVRGRRTNDVRGRLAPREALERMLAGTDLAVVEDTGTGAFVIRRLDPAKDAAAGPAGDALASGATYVSAGATGAIDREIELSPFEVRGRADLGYRPANSVAATRVATTIRNLPMTVSAFTSEFIADQKAYDLYDIVKWSPGVHHDNVSPQGWVRYSVRGFNSASVQRNGFRAFRFIDTTNIARVEVVKGPVSLLYGQINPGGVINYVTKRPEPAPATEISVGAGSHGFTRGVVDTTGPVPGTDGAVLGRLVAMTESIQQFHVGAKGRKNLIAPSLAWDLGRGHSLHIDYERFERLEDGLTSGVPLIYENGRAVGPYPGLRWDFSYAGEGDFQDFVSDAWTIEWKARLGDAVHLRAAWLESRWDMEWRATGQGATGLLSQAAIDAYYPPERGLTPRDAMFRRNRWEHQRGSERSFQIDLTSAHQAGPFRLRTLVGMTRNLDLSDRSIQHNNPATPGHPLYIRPWDLRDPATWDRRVPFGIDALVPVVDNTASRSGTSAYAVVSASALDERLHLLGGYAHHHLHNRRARNRIDGTSSEPSIRSRSVPQLGALYNLGRAVAVFGTYSESFLANPTRLRIDNVPTSPAQPSIGRGWEAGAKVELLEGRISGTLSAYSITAGPTGILIVTSGVDSSGTTLFTDIQGGRQESTGYEIELVLTPVDGLQIFAAYGRCDAVYSVHPTNPALNGSRLVAAPDRVFNLWSKWTPVRSGATRLHLTGGINHVGEMAYVGNNPAARLRPYTTLDLGLGVDFRLFDRQWTADALVKNVTDRRYYASNSSWGFPRHAVVTLSTRF